eukprot:SAG11_NODE_29489_length_310_cov_0.976303_1_plen_33_part_10
MWLQVRTQALSTSEYSGSGGDEDSSDWQGWGLK